ncbi:MAG: hypothetical protein IPH97_15790 [Ignavibacteriales bacterium]|nr:hypothetical protein [Ignavibacteriales bacterium]
MRNLISFLILFMVILIITSCREDIIEPGNFAGNVNEPIQDNQMNNYSFLINAQDFSSSFSVSTNFNYNTSRILLNSSEIEKGLVTIVIKDDLGVLLFSSIVETELTNKTEKISGAIPGKIDISFRNFTGKLKISLSYVSE